MIWFLLIVIQILLWWVTFFKTKKMTRTREENRWGNKQWGEFSLTSERYKFPLWVVFFSLLGCLVPIVGFVILVPTYAMNESKYDHEWEAEKPSFWLLDILKKEI